MPMSSPQITRMLGFLPPSASCPLAGLDDTSFSLPFFAAISLLLVVYAPWDFPCLAERANVKNHVDDCGHAEDQQHDGRDQRERYGELTLTVNESIGFQLAAQVTQPEH